MSLGVPPLPGAGSPPPPGPAQRLAANAGAVVYEGGNSLFDEPVLVYLSDQASRRPNLRILSHVDRPLGATTKLGNPGPFTVNVTTAVVDAGGVIVLKVRSNPSLFRFVYEISGVASGRYTMSSVASAELTLEANNEHFGYIKGAGFRGLGGRILAILDHNRNQVGELRSFIDRKNVFRQSVSYVLALDAGLGGELRRLLVAAPVVVDGVRRSREGGH